MGIKIAAALGLGLVSMFASSAIASDFDNRGFSISQRSVNVARHTLSRMRFPLVRTLSSLKSDFDIAEDLARYCEARSMGYDDRAYGAMQDQALDQVVPITDRDSVSIRTAFLLYRTAIVPTAKVYVCPQFDKGI